MILGAATTGTDVPSGRCNASVAIVAVGVALPYSPLAGVLGFQPLPAGYFLFLTLATFTYLGLVQLAKGFLLGKKRPYRHRVPIAQLEAP